MVIISKPNNHHGFVWLVFVWVSICFTTYYVYFFLEWRLSGDASLLKSNYSNPSENTIGLKWSSALRGVFCVCGVTERGRPVNSGYWKSKCLISPEEQGYPRRAVVHCPAWHTEQCTCTTSTCLPYQKVNDSTRWIQMINTHMWLIERLPKSVWIHFQTLSSNKDTVVTWATWHLLPTCLGWTDLTLVFTAWEAAHIKGLLIPRNCPKKFSYHKPIKKIIIFPPHVTLIVLKNEVYTSCITPCSVLLHITAPWCWGHLWGTGSSQKTSSLDRSKSTIERWVLLWCVSLLFTSALMGWRVLVWHEVQFHVDRIYFLFQVRCRQRKLFLLFFWNENSLIYMDEAWNRDNVLIFCTD